ncbi:MAG: transposase, partial [Okeania sp. SIO2D1]|nr:transposase [Okeania sp. SIO2D1]
HYLAKGKTKADCLVLEPTGIHYAKVWATVAKYVGVEVRWVGHQESVFTRRSERLPNKNDQADALALAAYVWNHWEQPEYFLDFQPGIIAEIRNLYYQINSLLRIKNPLINRLRQQLAEEFPEAATASMETSKRDGLQPLFAWLANYQRKTLKKNSLWKNKHKQSCLLKYGVKISQFTKDFSYLTCRINELEFQYRSRLSQLINSEIFKNYNLVFDEFNFNYRLRAIILIQIYPLTRFSSIKSFKRRLGMGKEQHQSGDMQYFRNSGSSEARSQLLLWCRQRIVNPKFRPTTPIGKELGNKYDELLAKYSSDGDLGKIQAITKYFDKQIEAIAKIEISMAETPNSPALLQIKAVKLATIQSKDALILAAQSGVNVDLPSVGTSQKARGFKTLIAFKVISLALRRLWPMLKKANCS